MSQALISPKVDVVFKMLFGRKQNEALLLSLLRAVLPRPKGREIVEIEILNPILDVEWFGEKEPVLDIRAKDAIGEIFNIEMQCQNMGAFLEREVYYWSRLYSQQLERGQGYTELCPVICIVFADFVVFRELEKWKTRWMWREDDGALLTTHGEIHFIELPKFAQIPKVRRDKLSKWLQFLGEGERMTPEQIQEWKDKDLAHAYEELEQLSRDPKMKHYYEERLKGLNDYASVMQDNYNKGKMDGKMEGEAKGQAKLVQRLYKNGMSKSDIARMTESTEAQVQAWLSQSPETYTPTIAEPPIMPSSAEDSAHRASKKKARSAKRK